MAQISSITTTTATISQADFVAWLATQVSAIAQLAPLAALRNPAETADRVAEVVFPVSGDQFDSLLRLAVPSLPAIGGYQYAILQTGPNALVTITWTH